MEVRRKRMSTEIRICRGKRVSNERKNCRKKKSVRKVFLLLASTEYLSGFFLITRGIIISSSHDGHDTDHSAINGSRCVIPQFGSSLCIFG